MANKRTRDAHNGSQQNHGKRRKFEGAGPSTAADIERSLKEYLHHALKVLHKHVKKSRTFETQKLARKLKQTKTPKDGKVDQELVKQLEQQFTALKSLSIDEIPFQIISSRLSKLAFLKPHLSLVTTSLSTTFASQNNGKEKSFEPTKEQLDPTSLQGKVRNRVLANKVVKEGWDECVNGFKKRVGHDDDNLKKEEQQEKGKGMTVDPERLKQIEKQASKTEMRRGHESAQSEDEGSDESEFDGSEGDDESAIDDDEVERELARLNGDGGGEDDSSQGEWSDSDEDDALVAGSGDDVNDDDAEDSDAASDSSYPILSKRQRESMTQNDKKSRKADSSAKAVAKPTKMASSSTFLPTLASGYISFSDSDGEDAIWIKDDERQEKKQRKNRRGQRARQAIWEKKYGSGAKHIAKQMGTSPALTKKERESLEKKKQKQASVPFDPKNAPGGSANPNAIAVDVNKKRRRTVTYESSKSIVPVVAVKAAEATAAAAANGDQKQQMNTGWQKRDAKKKQEDEGLHPSWQAKKKAQEALQMVASTAPKGKKIVFD
ncbi:hypothetical protein ACM66B_003109 [Microbotryomycetes sp. NB124-2]